MCLLCIVIMGVVQWSAKLLGPGTEGHLVLFGMCLKFDGENRELICLAFF